MQQPNEPSRRSDSLRARRRSTDPQQMPGRNTAVNKAACTQRQTNGAAEPLHLNAETSLRREERRGRPPIPRQPSGGAPVARRSTNRGRDIPSDRDRRHTAPGRLFQHGKLAHLSPAAPRGKRTLSNKGAAVPRRVCRFGTNSEAIRCFRPERQARLQKERRANSRSVLSSTRSRDQSALNRLMAGFICIVINIISNIKIINIGDYFSDLRLRSIVYFICKLLKITMTLSPTSSYCTSA